MAELEHAHFGGAAAQNPTTDINDSSQVLASSPVKAVDSPKSTKLSDLVCCEGLCLRSFHVGCLAEDVQEDILNENNSSKKWLCDDCQNGSYECSVCHNYGTLYDRNTGKKYNNKIHVIKCEREDCGRFYHKKCLQKYKANFMERHNISTGEILKDAATRGKKKRKRNCNASATARYECPAHMCATCGKRETLRSVHLGGSAQRLYTCIHCPTSYHFNCITPFCKMNASYMNCSDHCDSHLPKPRVVDQINPKQTKQPA